jgi:2-methylcitrate dehydratase PrpD
MATEKIAQFISETNYEKIPLESIDIAKKAILDYFGVAVAGSNESGVRIMSELVKQIGAIPEAAVICGGFKTSADSAAWINGTMSHALDYDDTVANSARYNMHPSVAVLPAVFALGEKCKVSGKEILTAYIAGMEVAYVIGPAMAMKATEMGWHTTSMLGTISAAAASANILKLNPSQTSMAFGIASSLAGGLGRNVGTMTKPMHAGNAARNGVVAALLAKNGFTGNRNIMEGEASFCSMFTGGVVREPTDRVSDLGRIWNIVSTGIAFKPYPSCRATHSCIDATLHLRKELDITEEQVAEIVCKVNLGFNQYWILHEPKTGYEAKFSFEYCVATALIRGKVSLDDFSDAKFNDAKVQNFLPRVSVVYPKDWVTGIDLAQEIVIKLKNGTVHSYCVTSPKGEPENPMTHEELTTKLEDCIQQVPRAQAIKSIVDKILNIEELEDVRNLMDTVML